MPLLGLETPVHAAEGDNVAQRPHCLCAARLFAQLLPWRRRGRAAGRVAIPSLLLHLLPDWVLDLPNVSREMVRKGVQRDSKQAVHDWLEIRAQTVIVLWFRQRMRAAPYQTTETFAPDTEMESQHVSWSWPPLAAPRMRLLPVRHLLTGQDFRC